jgi:hypothetical protein
MELHLGLALSTYNSCAYDATTKIHDFPFNHNTNNKKRSFSQPVFEHAAENSTNFPTLSLLPLTPGHSDDHDHQHCSHSSNTTITK